MKRLLIAGGSGFVGRAIVQHYRESGWQVSTIGRRPDDDYAIQHLSSLNLPVQYDRLIHTLAINETMLDQDLEAAYRVNVVLTRQLVELCKRHQIKELVYLSTFHVYGKSVGDIDETTPVAPTNDYSLTHYLSERIVTDLADGAGYTPLILRPTNIYGLPDSLDTFHRWSLVPFDFARRAVRNMDISLKHPATQRNFVSIDDVVAATEQVGSCKIINVFGADTMTILQFAQQVVATVQYSQSQIKSDAVAPDVQGAALQIRSQNIAFQPRSQLVDFIQKFAAMVAQDE